MEENRVMISGVGGPNTSVVPAPVLQPALTSTELVARRHTILDVLRHVMIEGVHCGSILGVKGKMLLKPGADLLCNTFRLAPRYEIRRYDLGNGHREYEITAHLTHAVTEQFWGSGLGSCSTQESKYRYRQGTRSCPHCGKETIIKGRAEYGGGWVCLVKNGGCGAKFTDSDEAILGQATGKVDNPDIADVYNTVLKMAKKRALADAVITATGCADMFVADEIEDLPEDAAVDTGAGLADDAREEAQPERSAAASSQQVGLLMGACKSFGVTEERLKQYLKESHNIDSRKAIPLTLYNEILAWVKKQK